LVSRKVLFNDVHMKCVDIAALSRSRNSLGVRSATREEVVDPVRLMDVNVDKSSFIRILFHSVIYALFQDVRFIVLCALWCGYLMVTAKRVKNLRPICLCWSTADVCTIGCVAFCTVLHQIRSNLLKYVWSVSPSLFSVNCGPELLSCTSSPYYPLTENGRETSICFCVLFYLISWQNVAERQLCPVLPHFLAKCRWKATEPGDFRFSFYFVRISFVLRSADIKKSNWFF